MFNWSRSFLSQYSRQSAQTQGGAIELLYGIQETGNNHWKDFFDDGKVKLSSDSSQNGERLDEERNGSALWPAIWKIIDNLFD